MITEAALPTWTQPVDKAMCYQVDVMWTGSDGSDHTETYPIIAHSPEDAEERTYQFLSSLDDARIRFGLPIPLNVPPTGQFIGVTARPDPYKSDVPITRLNEA